MTDLDKVAIKIGFYCKVIENGMFITGFLIGTVHMHLYGGHEVSRRTNVYLFRGTFSASRKEIRIAVRHYVDQAYPTKLST